jgi:hypothetical protein
MRDRRLEPTYSANGLSEMIILSGVDYKRASVTVVDVSKNDFQLELDGAIRVGAQIELRLRHSIVFAEVRNCRQLAKGKYSAGVRSHKVLESPLRDRHISDYHVEFYAKEGGYTDAGRQMLADHLGLCVDCKAKIDEARRLLAMVSALQLGPSRAASPLP